MSMYNKLFTKILDSSIWLEADSTRIVWLTMIAAMDEEGFVMFASIPNLARRANVTLDAAEKAVAVLEGPDKNSSDPEFEGRRIERVDGGWLVLNAPKYRELVTRAIARERTRERVAKFRAAKKGNAPVTHSNGDVTPSYECVTDPDPDSGKGSAEGKPEDVTFEEFWKAYPNKTGKGNARKAWKKLKCKAKLPEILTGVRLAKSSDQWTKEGGRFIPHPATWLNREGWLDDPSTWPTGNGSRMEQKRKGEYPMTKQLPIWRPSGIEGQDE